jgi:hypothetical protein
MSGLKMTRELVEDTHNKAGNHLLNTPDDVGAQEYYCYSTDWLAMYNLLKEIADDRPTCDGEINQLVKRIRALIGGE